MWKYDTMHLWSHRKIWLNFDFIWTSENFKGKSAASWNLHFQRRKCSFLLKSRPKIMHQSLESKIHLISLFQDFLCRFEIYHIFFLKLTLFALCLLLLFRRIKIEWKICVFILAARYLSVSMCFCVGNIAVFIKVRILFPHFVFFLELFEESVCKR